jgi:hypothetical protein
VNEKLGRNDICYCGSNKKYKDCHLRPYYPKEYFQAQIKEFDSIRFENKAPEYISVGRIDVFLRDHYPWDGEISTVLKPFTEIVWDEKDTWQNRIKKRVDKLYHKLNAMKYHTYSFINFERESEENYKKYLVANTTLNKVFDNPHLIYNTESFLFQSKSCLDVFAQIIAYSFKFTISTYRKYGEDLINILKKEPSKNYPEYAKNIIKIIQCNKPWIKELVEMRNEVTHYSDLVGLSCFLIKKSEENDKIATIYYPAMTDGERVPKYMDKIWTNIQNLIHDSTPSLVGATRR